jgi:DNA-binding LytR/AlgR family response regulator
MRFTLLLFLTLLLTGPAAAEGEPWAFKVGPVHVCPSPEMSDGCRPVSLETLQLGGGEIYLVRTVSVDPAILPLPRPLMVWMVGMSSSEIIWNGVVIGRNGTPAASRDDEWPGRFFATFRVPDSLVRPGRNIAAARLSGHHIWLPVRRPIHIFDVGPYQTTELPGLASYLPALLALGALAAAGIYFTAAFALDRRDRSALLLALAAGTALLQLGAEIARAFIRYTYPWHLVRVSAIAIFAAITAILLAAYAARRFAPEWRRRVVVATAGASAAGLALVPWYDLKALAAILAGAAALIACGVRGIRTAQAGAWASVAAGLALIGLMAWQRTVFLDQAYYLVLAVLLVALVAEQILALRQARCGLGDERSRASLLEQRLRLAQGRDRFVALKDGAKAHRVAEADILFVRAADDYCEAHLADGRILLVTMTLAALHAALPGHFLRVHKSYVVNSDHVVALSPRAGGGRTLKLSDGSSVPVGRAYRDSVEGGLAAG